MPRRGYAMLRKLHRRSGTQARSLRSACFVPERRGRLRHGFRRARVIRASHRADDVARLDRPTLKRADGTGPAQSAHTMQQGEPAPPRSRPRSIPVGYAPARWASEDPPWCRRAGALRHRTRRPRLGATEGSYRTRSAHSAARGGPRLPSPPQSARAPGERVTRIEGSIRWWTCGLVVEARCERFRWQVRADR